MQSIPKLLATLLPHFFFQKFLSVSRFFFLPNRASWYVDCLGVLMFGTVLYSHLQWWITNSRPSCFNTGELGTIISTDSSCRLRAILKYYISLERWQFEFIESYTCSACVLGDRILSLKERLQEYFSYGKGKYSSYYSEWKI